jgi:hypothetical protein
MSSLWMVTQSPVGQYNWISPNSVLSVSPETPGIIIVATHPSEALFHKLHAVTLMNGSTHATPISCLENVIGQEWLCPEPCYVGGCCVPEQMRDERGKLGEEGGTWSVDN